MFFDQETIGVTLREKRNSIVVENWNSVLTYLITTVLILSESLFELKIKLDNANNYTLHHP